MSKKIVLIGTVTRDVISFDTGETYTGLGGILYQAAALCGLNKKVLLCTNIGQDLTHQIDKIIRRWPTLDTSCIRNVSAASNLVRLHYPESGERVEVLESVVPAIESDRVRNDLCSLDMLVAVCNSGYDFILEEWRKIVQASSCPVWFDIHSLVLSKEIGRPRKYMPVFEWQRWIKDVTYVQANLMELSCLVGDPGKKLTQDDCSAFGAMAFSEGVKAVFITLGREGVLVISPFGSRKISLSAAVEVQDTTGCGDVFCAATVAKLAEGTGLFDAARFGVHLAARATETQGIEETFALTSQYPKER